MIIGKFTRTEAGRISGFLDTIHGDIGLTFVPQTKGAAYQIVTDQGCEVGAGWNKTSKDGGKSFVSVKLDSPILLAAINCALFSRDNNEFVLVWDRPGAAQNSGQE
jgi:uncharacterized protein (DUF736 family)